MVGEPGVILMSFSFLPFSFLDLVSVAWAAFCNTGFLISPAGGFLHYFFRQLGGEGGSVTVVMDLNCTLPFFLLDHELVASASHHLQPLELE